jgi:hypothetical protein
MLHNSAMNPCRRDFLRSFAALGLGTLLPAGSLSQTTANAQSRKFRIWVFSDPHVGRDLKYGNGRESLADAIRQSE